MALKDAYDLTTLIEEGRNNAYNIKDCSLLTDIGGVISTISGCFFDKYIDFIKEKSVKVVLTSDELTKYKYKPKLLSYDLYGTEELWFLILRLNNICHEMDFTKKIIYLLLPNNIKVLNKILIINDDEIKANHAEVLNQ